MIIWTHLQPQELTVRAGERVAFSLLDVLEHKRFPWIVIFFSTNLLIFSFIKSIFVFVSFSVPLRDYSPAEHGLRSFCRDPTGDRRQTSARVGWHFLSKATSLIRLHLFYAFFFVSRIILTCWRLSAETCGKHISCSRGYLRTSPQC